MTTLLWAMAGVVVVLVVVWVLEIARLRHERAARSRVQPQHHVHGHRRDGPHDGWMR